MKVLRYNNTKDDRPSATAVWLQEVGWVEGCNATEVKPGMVMIYNGGMTHEVLRVQPRGKTAVAITVMTTDGEWTDVRRGRVPCQPAE